MHCGLFRLAFNSPVRLSAKSPSPWKNDLMSLYILSVCVQFPWASFVCPGRLWTMQRGESKCEPVPETHREPEVWRGFDNWGPPVNNKCGMWSKIDVLISSLQQIQMLAESVVCGKHYSGWKSKAFKKKERMGSLKGHRSMPTLFSILCAALRIRLQTACRFLVTAQCGASTVKCAQRTIGIHVLKFYHLIFLVNIFNFEQKLKLGIM